MCWSYYNAGKKMNEIEILLQQKSSEFEQLKKQSEIEIRKLQFELRN